MPLLRSFLLLASLAALPAMADEQAFYHITAQQCSVIDSLPVFTKELRPTQLAGDYRIELLFPEYRELTAAERALIPELRSKLGTPTTPEIRQMTLVDRGMPVLSVSFSPFVHKNGKWKYISSCQLRAIPVTSAPLSTRGSANTDERWTTQSVLSQGKWVKIRVKEEGIYQITPDLLRRMGFSNPERVKVYGYGGLQQDEVLAFDAEPAAKDSRRVADDLTEVPTLRNNDGKILFWAEGTVRRTYDQYKKRWTLSQNSYSTYAYYFITEGDAPLTVEKLPAIAADSETPHTTVPYAVTLDTDEAGFYEGGRRFFDGHDFAQGNSRNFKVNVLDLAPTSADALPIEISWGASSATGTTTAEFKLNGENLGRAAIGSYYSLTESARANTSVFEHAIRPGENTINMVTTQGNHARLDYITINYPRLLTVADRPYSFSPQTDVTTTLQAGGVGEYTQVWRIGQMGSPTAALTLTSKSDGTGQFTTDTPRRRFVIFNTNRDFPQPEIVGNVANQNLHADRDIDYVIAVPTGGKLTAQAERLAEIHRRRGLTVKVIPANLLYNEFSSGTPDANALRRYLKMLYDRASTPNKAPRYLLLMGKSPWDNRFVTEEWKNQSADDYLLAYEYDASTQSIGTVSSFVTDDFYALLDDGEGKYIYSEKVDLSTGRMVCTTEEEAKILVDKVERYLKNEDAGPWKNKIVMMADDGDSNEHAEDAERVSTAIAQNGKKRFTVDKVYWDYYTRVPGATSLTYPAASAAIEQSVASGAALFNYSGHGSPTVISNEKTLVLDDFKRFSAPHLGLWVLASCEIYPFDSRESNLADIFLFRPNSGAVAFMCATRAVYATQNNALNIEFCKRLFSRDPQGQLTSMGEALRQAKNQLISSQSDLTINKMKYVLFGDPAIPLSIPTGTAVLDSIDGKALATTSNVRLSAGQVVTFSGHIEDSNGNSAVDQSFNGTLTAEIYDRDEARTCKDNDGSAARVGRRPLSFTAHGHKVFRGTTRVENGRFTITASIPRDISYSNDAAKISFYAVSDDKQTECNGINSSFHLNGTAAQASPDTIAPKVVAYLNEVETPEYGIVNRNPTLIADISDDSGINISGTSIGHDIEFTLDDDLSSTVSLNEHFTYAPGSYNSGQLVYRLPTLAPGLHTMTLRVWDVNNNSTTQRLGFIVSDGAGQSTRVYSTVNPASTHTTFVAGFPAVEAHEATLVWEVYDHTGKIVWTKHNTVAAKSGTAAVAWNLRSNDGLLMPEGLYVVKATIKSPGQKAQQATQKLIIVRP